MASNDDVFDVEGPQRGKKPDPPYMIYRDSRISVSRAVGKMMKMRHDAAIKAYEHVWESWNEVYRYYNNDQKKTTETSKGTFKRGDGTENIVFSNVNVALPATYSKNPDITCNTEDKDDEPFCKTLQVLINTLFRKRDKLHAKPKVKKAVGMTLLTNQGVLKLEYTQKDDSRETALAELNTISQALAEAKTPKEAEELYGQLSALEAQVEVMDPSGPALKNILPHNLIIDPFAEQADGSDANWMEERVWLPTEFLKARFTQKKGDGRTLIYKSTHKAVFDTGAGEREDGLGVVLEAIDAGSEAPTDHTDEERLSYIYTYMTECYYVWDKPSRRVFLFHRDDWDWPLWVWDDPLGLTRFFPYFIMAFSMSTGGTTSVGETSYYLDQQDEVNDINRQLTKIRRSVFNYFFYNTDKIKQKDIEPLIRALKGEGSDQVQVVGSALGDDGRVSDAIEALLPPSANYAPLFQKEHIYEAVNRISSVNEGLRGVQFKTNTNEAAVTTYQDAMKISVGAKVDVIEDTMEDIALALSELCIQFMDKQEVSDLIGKVYGKDWRQMTVATFNATYNLQIVGGSTEKPNSVFKKKEAVQIAQAVGQFAQAAPGTTLKVMLKVLEQAFTEVVIKPEDWDMIDAEIQANQQKGISTGGTQGQDQPQGQTQTSANGQGQSQGQNIEEVLRRIPPEVKQKAVQMSQSGASPQEIAAFIKQQVQGASQGASQPTRM